MAAVMGARWCLCAHPMHWHLLQAGVCIDGCSCVEFVADVEPDDQKYPIPAPFSNHYPADGRYKTPKNGWPLHD